MDEEVGEVREGGARWGRGEERGGDSHGGVAQYSAVALTRRSPLRCVLRKRARRWRRPHMFHIHTCCSIVLDVAVW